MALWKPVPGFDSHLVSDEGEIKSVKTGKVLRQHLTHNGYHAITLSKPGHKPRYRRTLRVHCVVLEAFVGPRPDGMVARHLDDNKDNNSLVNLAWGTNHENYMDQVRAGTHGFALRWPKPA